MRLAFRRVTGQLDYIELQDPLSDTIRTVQSLVAAKASLEEASLKLCFKGTVLKPHHTILQAGLSENDTLVAVGKPLPKTPATSINNKPPPTLSPSSPSTSTPNGDVSTLSQPPTEVSHAIPYNSMAPVTAGSQASNATNPTHRNLNLNSNTGTSNTSTGTSNTSTCTSNTSTGTSNTSTGTSNTSTGTSNTSTGTSNTSTCTSNTSTGTSNTSTGTSNTSTGTSNTSTGTSNTSTGTSNTSTGTSNTSTGTSNTSTGTSNTSTTNTSHSGTSTATPSPTHTPPSHNAHLSQLTEMGFPALLAEEALHRAGGNLHRALQRLLRGESSGGRGRGSDPRDAYPHETNMEALGHMMDPLNPSAPMGVRRRRRRGREDSDPVGRGTDLPMLGGGLGMDVDREGGGRGRGGVGEGGESEEEEEEEHAAEMMRVFFGAEGEEGDEDEDEDEEDGLGVEFMSMPETQEEAERLVQDMVDSEGMLFHGLLRASAMRVPLSPLLLEQLIRMGSEHPRVALLMGSYPEIALNLVNAHVDALRDEGFTELQHYANREDLEPSATGEGEASKDVEKDTENRERSEKTCEEGLRQKEVSDDAKSGKGEEPTHDFTEAEKNNEDASRENGDAASNDGA